MNINLISLTTVFAPLLAALIVGLNSTKISKAISQLITCTAMIISTVCAWQVFYYVAIDKNIILISLFEWLKIGSAKVSWAIFIDSLSAVMLLMVTTISCLIHFYSIGYMASDNSVPRFMAYLSIFTFFMLMLVCADNFIQLFFGWEGVGLCSYLLIGFWFEKKSASKASMKAFIVNRIGDCGLVLAIMLIFYVFDTFNFNEIFKQLLNLEEFEINYTGNYQLLNVIGLLLFFGAMGKSAQLGMHIWLPDAMEGPTPVSALIHAATMVTAGIFMIVRCSFLLEAAPFALEVITLVGALTCLFAAMVAITQTDIKRIIAYSTCSQLGYMFMACGVSSYGIAIFHLFTHAFFKALLFLGAGSVIHSYGGEQEITKMGGASWRKIPITYLMMVIGSLALAGIFPFAGFYSKDAIIEAAYNSDSTTGQFAYVVGIFVALCTAFYSWRLLMIIFYNNANHKSSKHLHESPIVMVIPLVILAAFSITAGWIGENILHMDDSQFWQGAIVIKPQNHHNFSVIKHIPMTLAIIGIAAAVFLYAIGIKRNYPLKLSLKFPFAFELVKNKFYFDEIYNRLLVEPIKKVSNILWRYFDIKIIDSFPNGLAAVSLSFSKITSKFQSGHLQHYIAVMVISSLLILAIILNNLRVTS
jgi:NADH-quinone oxidoreductase subunit L